MEAFVRDLRYVARSLSRTPGFFAVTAATLGLGIGATTAIFSVINGVLLQALPYPEPERVVQLWQVGPKRAQMQFSEPNFDDLAAASRSFAAIAEFTNSGVVPVSGTTEPSRARASTVSRGFFDVLGVRPLVGRVFAPDELRQGGAPAVVVSEGFWRRRMGANPALAGRTLAMEGRVFNVVGVMPARVDFPAGTDVWTPKEVNAPNPYRTGHNWQAIGRLAGGASLAQARQEATAIAKRLKTQYGDDDWMEDADIIPLREQLTGSVRQTLLVLLAASGVLLLIACANVVNLLVARMASRQSELALRLALGAGRRRLAQQFLTEALVLSVAGGVLGVALAAFGVRALLALGPSDLPRLTEVRLDGRVLAFALGVSVLAAIALGLLTAWRATRGDIREAMQESQRTQSGVGSNHRIRSGLVVAQMALTLVLLVGAGLLGRSFLRLMRIDPGFRAEKTIVLDVSTPSEGDSTSLRQRVRFYDDLIAKLRAIPGVTNAGSVNAFPLAGGNTSDGTFLILSRIDEPLNMAEVPRLQKDPVRAGQAEFRIASPGYFRAMHIPLVRGRLFDDRDAIDAPHVAVISASLAKRKWANEDPLGKIIQFGNMDGDLRPFTIVGVVGDVHELSLASKPRPTFYAFYRQRPIAAGTFNVAIATPLEAAPVIAAARAAVRDLRPDVPPRVRTIESVVSASLADRRFMLLLVGTFGVAALLLATLGVYSVISFLVTQRRQEIGIRVALGAQTSDVIRLVVRQGAVLAFIGIVVGAAIAFALTRLLTAFLYDVSATDPVAFGGVVLLLAVVALAASFIPARRATAIDPMRALRG